MRVKATVRGVGATFAVVGALGVTTAALEAQPGGRTPAASRLADFPDAQRALAAAGVEEMGAINSILTTLENGVPTFYFSVARLKADAELRTTLVRSLGPTLPAVIESPMFGDLYRRMREETATRQLGEPPQDPAVARADAISGLRMTIADLEAQARAPGLSRRQRGDLESALETARGSLAQLQRQANDAATRAAEQQQLAEARAAYAAQREAAQAELEATLPADPRQLVANRLQAFVSGCRDVNFRARTTTDGGVVRFVSAADEARPKLWKLCYRAGQRTVTEARRVATSWLTQLSRAGIRPRTPS